MRYIYLSAILVILSFTLKSQPWVPDLQNGKYKNPVLFADYSDPDVIRVEDDFYLVSSSFTCMPGIPVLHSKDLVNWKIINHVYNKLPLEKYNKPVHGEGSWAPSIRFHNNLFYVYFCTPRDGLFMATAKNPAGEWELNHIEEVEMWEDPCPFWDDDTTGGKPGSAYLVRSKLCGNELFLHKMSPNGKKILDNGVLIYKDILQPTIEGPKLYKKDGYYYILAPAGGVPQGWQVALRSKSIYGPYEAKNIMHQGSTGINGPHQGGLVELKSGEWWFMHFQDRDLYGRVVHLQPVAWNDGWPIIGTDNNNDGTGEPVTEYKKPDVGKSHPAEIPATSDEFNDPLPGLQWQWHANPVEKWFSLAQSKGNLRLYAVKNHTQNGNLWFVPNLLLQKFPSPSFTVTTKIEFNAMLPGEKAGLLVMGDKWTYLALVKTEKGISVVMEEGTFNQCNDMTTTVESVELPTNSCYLRVFVNENGICHYYYSIDNKEFIFTGKEIKAQKGRWIGAKVGLFCINPNINESTGYADFEWFRMD
ncbi:MAG: glycoside hydrolase 43 family protein [Bacteroidales bacterium]